MATEETSPINIQNNRITIDEFETTDSTIVEYFQQFDSESERGDAFELPC